MLRGHGRGARHYDRALCLAEHARAIAPDDPDYLNTLGAARYRTGLFDCSLEALVLSDQINRTLATPHHHRSYDLVYIAMAHHRLGHTRESKEAFAGACRLAEGEDDPELAGLLREAEAVFGKRTD